MLYYIQIKERMLQNVAQRYKVMSYLFINDYHKNLIHHLEDACINGNKTLIMIIEIRLYVMLLEAYGGRKISGKEMEWHYSFIQRILRH